MTGFEVAYLTMVVAGATMFGLVLAWATYRH